MISEKPRRGTILSFFIDGNLVTFSTYTPIIVLAAVLLDLAFGEVRRWHPLVGFGRWAEICERFCRKFNVQAPATIAMGAASVCLAVIPILVVTVFLDHYLQSRSALLSALFSCLVLYLALGARSLKEHGLAVSTPLFAGDLDLARQKLSWIVSRDTSGLDEPAVNRATIESMLENGSDAIFAAIFWFVVAGVPGVVLYRLANTLDALWGYRNEKYLYFGRFAARFDDLLNLLPARLTALSYCLVGAWKPGIECWRKQAPLWDSPNAGPVMAAGAGALEVRLGGHATYHGELHQRPELGCGKQAQKQDIVAAIALINRSLVLWLLTLVVLANL